MVGGGCVCVCWDGCGGWFEMAVAVVFMVVLLSFGMSG